MRIWTIALVLLLLIAGQVGAAPPFAVIGKPAPDFTLTGQNGASVTLSRFRGRLVLLSFIYTRCVDVCPLITANLARVQRDLIARGGKHIINPAVMLPSGGKTYAGTGYANSGLPPDPTKPLTFSLTFTKEGRYGYLCLVHGPSMGGEIVVGGPTTNDPDEVLASAKQQQAQTLKIGEAAFGALTYDVMQGKVTVPLIGSVRDGYSILRFTREPLVIRRGTQVTWAMADPFEIHTVTFGSGAKPVDYVLPEPQAGGPPLLVVNARIATPTRRTTYDGTGFVNSGVLFPPRLAPNLPTRFSLTFTKAGTYQVTDRAQAIVRAREAGMGQEKRKL